MPASVNFDRLMPFIMVRKSSRESAGGVPVSDAKEK